MHFAERRLLEELNSINQDLTDSANNKAEGDEIKIVKNAASKARRDLESAETEKKKQVWY